MSDEKAAAPKMTQREYEDLQRKLAKRGFHREGIPLDCPKCGERALVVYQTKQSLIGGRDIEWCWNADCGVVMSYRRRRDGRDLEDGFDLKAFLA